MTESVEIDAVDMIEADDRLRRMSLVARCSLVSRRWRRAGAMLVVTAAFVAAGALGPGAGTGEANSVGGHWVVRDLGVHIKVSTGDGGAIPPRLRWP